MSSDGLLHRTKAFSLKTIRFIESLPPGRTSEVIGKQLLRSATSVGANYRSACRAKSKADFISKLSVVEEEADECMYWLELLSESGVVERSVTADLYEEADEITAMIVASIKSSRNSSLLRTPHSQFRTPSALPTPNSALRGVTLIEMLIALIISSIAMMALAIPFVAERAFSLSGKAQAESQRDAEVVLRAMARAGREGSQYSVGAGTLSFDVICPCPGPLPCPAGTRQFTKTGAQLQMTDTCIAPQPLTLIDGNRSKVQDFTITSIIPNKLVRIHLEITHAPIVGGPRQEDEILESEVFLRNAL